MTNYDCDCNICAYSKKHPQLNAPRCWYITADNITDEQIRALMRGDHGPCEETRTMCLALFDLHTKEGRESAKYKARARCAEILNARAKRSQ